MNTKINNKVIFLINSYRKLPIKYSSFIYPYIISNEEVVLNFWAFSDEHGNVQRIAGKAAYS